MTTDTSYHSGGKLSVEAQILLRSYRGAEKAKEVFLTPKFKVNRAVSAVAFFYEKIRNAIDNKSEHLLRRNAIERILKRLLWERPKAESQIISGALVRELVWSRYLDDENISHETVEEIRNILNYYFQMLLFLSSYSPKFEGEKDEFKSEILGVTSAHIEEVLDPSLLRTTVITNAMFTWFMKHFEWADTNLSEDEKKPHLYLAIERSLAKSDDARIRFHLLKEKLSGRKVINRSNEEDFFATLSEIDRYLNSPTQTRLYRFVKNYAPPFRILKELVDVNPFFAERLFDNEIALEESITEKYFLHEQKINRNITVGIIRSVIYILVTKMLVVFLIEIPYELLWVGRLAYLPLAINIITPPLFMSIVGLSIKKPNPQTRQRIIEIIRSFVYQTADKGKVAFSIEKRQKKGFVYNFFALLYGIFFFLLLGGITYLLFKMHFSLPSVIIFFMFLSLVLLFGFRVRASASELSMGEESEGFFSNLLTNLSLPFLDLGVWLSRGLSSLNVVMILMDFLIEAPLKIVIRVAQEWLSFVREKKDEIVEIPSE